MGVKTEGGREEREMPKVHYVWVIMCFCLERVRNEMKRGGGEVGTWSSFLVISKNPKNRESERHFFYGV